MAEGEEVYLRDNAVRGRAKIQDTWGPVKYRVIKAPSDGGAVYSIAPSDDPAKVKHVHRTHLRTVPQPTPPPGEFDLTAPETALPREEGEDQSGEWWIVPQPTRETLTPVAPCSSVTSPQLPTPAGPLAVATAAGDAEATDSMEGTSGTGPSAIRRSQRETAGRHANPHHLPVAVGQRGATAATSRVPGSGNMHSMFRSWSWT